MSGKAKKKLAAAVNALNAINDEKASHFARKAPLYRSIHAEASIDPLVACEEFRTLTGVRLANIRQLIKLNQDRKKRLDTAVQTVKSLLPNSPDEESERERTALEDAAGEAAILQHEIASHQALLQMRVWDTGGISSERARFSSASSADLATQIKVIDDWGTRIIEMLKEVPGDHPLGFRFAGTTDARGLLFTMLEKQGALLDRRIEIFLQTFNASISMARPEAWPEMDSTPLRMEASARNEEGQGNGERGMQECRDAIALLDRKVYYSELYSKLYEEVAVPEAASVRPLFEKRLMTQHIEADSLALRYAHALVDAQSHFPASMARVLDLNQELVSHLIFKVAPNIQLLCDELKTALDQVPSSKPEALIKRMDARASQALKDEDVNWELPMQLSEAQEEYRLLRQLQPAYLTAADQLQLLAIRMRREAKGKDKMRACDSLKGFAADCRLVAKLIGTHREELTDFGVEPESLGESERSAALGARLRDMDWVQGALAANRDAEMPDDASDPESEAESDVRHDTEKTEEAQERRNDAIPASVAKREQRLERKRIHFRDLETQQLKLAQEMLDRLRDGDTSEDVTAGKVETTLKSALGYKKQRLALSNGNPALEQDIRAAESSMRLQVAEAISLKPSQQAIQRAIDLGMRITVTRPVILDVTSTRENDFIHRYVFEIEGFQFKLHAHYDTAVVTLDQKPTKIHFKRFDERGTDEKGRTVYYQDGRRAKAKYRSREATQGIATARQFLEPDEWRPLALPVRRK